MSEARKMPTLDLATLARFDTDPELREFEQRLSKFNLFEALEVGHRELSHSNFLAWLLNPKESHGQGPRFLSAFLSDLLVAIPNADDLGRFVAACKSSDLDIDVHREWASIDLLLISRSAKAIVVIENKIHTGEHSDQLARYSQFVKAGFPDFSHRWLFLTPEGDPPSDSKWAAYSYRRVHRWLHAALQESRGEMAADVIVVIEHYLDLIGNHIVSNNDIDALCRSILARHGRAIELLGRYTSNLEEQLLSEVSRRIKSDSTWTWTRQTKSFVNFAPASWPMLLPPICDDVSNLPWEWLVLGIVIEESSLELRLYLGKTRDLTLREQLRKALTGDRSILGVSTKNTSKNRRLPLVADKCVDWNCEEPDVSTIVDRTFQVLEAWRPMLRRVQDVIRRNFPTDA